MPLLVGAVRTLPGLGDVGLEDPAVVGMSRQVGSALRTLSLQRGILRVALALRQGQRLAQLVLDRARLGLQLAAFPAMLAILVHQARLERAHRLAQFSQAGRGQRQGLCVRRLLGVAALAQRLQGQVRLAALRPQRVDLLLCSGLVLLTAAALGFRLGAGEGCRLCGCLPLLLQRLVTCGECGQIPFQPLLAQLRRLQCGLGGLGGPGGHLRQFQLVLQLVLQHLSAQIKFLPLGRQHLARGLQLLCRRAQPGLAL